MRKVSKWLLLCCAIAANALVEIPGASKSPSSKTELSRQGTNH
jgi:hypothetical protein